MAQLYKIINRKSPTDSVTRKYASRMNIGKVDTETLAEELADEAGQSEGTILGLLEDLNNEIVSQLLMGYKVRMGNIGTLGLRFTGAGSASEEEYDTDNIRRVRIGFLPSTTLKSRIAMDSGNVDLVLYADESGETAEE